MTEKLTELDTTKLTTPIKNWVSRKGNAALAGFGNSGRAKARHEVRLIANKLYKGWQRYLVSRRRAGTPADMNGFVGRYFADARDTLSRDMPAIFPPGQGMGAGPGTTGAGPAGGGPASPAGGGPAGGSSFFTGPASPAGGGPGTTGAGPAGGGPAGGPAASGPGTTGGSPTGGPASGSPATGGGGGLNPRLKDMDPRLPGWNRPGAPGAPSGATATARTTPQANQQNNLADMQRYQSYLKRFGKMLGTAQPDKDRILRTAKSMLRDFSGRSETAKSWVRNYFERNLKPYAATIPELGQLLGPDPFANAPQRRTRGAGQQQQAGGQWRAVRPGEVFQPGGQFRMNQTTGQSEVLEPQASAGATPAQPATASVQPTPAPAATQPAQPATPLAQPTSPAPATQATTRQATPTAQPAQTAAARPASDLDIPRPPRGFRPDMRRPPEFLRRQRNEGKTANSRKVLREAPGDLNIPQPPPGTPQRMYRSKPNMAQPPAFLQRQRNQPAPAPAQAAQPLAQPARRQPAQRQPAQQPAQQPQRSQKPMSRAEQDKVMVALAGILMDTHMAQATSPQTAQNSQTMASPQQSSSSGRVPLNQQTLAATMSNLGVHVDTIGQVNALLQQNPNLSSVQVAQMLHAKGVSVDPALFIAMAQAAH